MHILNRLFVVILVVTLTACGPRVDKQFAQRQVAYIEIQAGGSVKPMQIIPIKDPLQMELINALRGRGKAPAVGLTFKISLIGFPDGQVIGAEGISAKFVGAGPNSANIVGTVELWDPTTRAVLTSFGVARSIRVRTHSTLGSVLGYPRGFEPDDVSSIYGQLSRAAAQEIAISLYGVN